MISLHRPHRSFLGSASYLVALAMLLVLPGIATAQTTVQSPALLREAFEGNVAHGQLPPNWVTFSLNQDKPSTTYGMTQVDGRTVLEAVADKSASIVIWEREFDPHELNVLEWEWRVERTLPEEVHDPEQTEDAPARVMVMFTYDPDQESLWDRITYDAMKLMYGVYPPARSMNYVWGNPSAPVTWQESRRTARVRSLVLPRGETGQWFRERRDLVADFRQAFGDAALPTRARIAIMADADASQAQVRSLFDSIVLGTPTSTIPATAWREPAPAGEPTPKN